MTEKTNIFYMKEGDRLPNLQMTLLDNAGNPLNLTGVEGIQLYIAPCVDGRKIVNGAYMDVVGDAANGVVEYEWQAGDTDKAGEYKVEVVIWFTSSGPSITQTVPRSGYDTLIITSRL